MKIDASNIAPNKEKEEAIVKTVFKRETQSHHIDYSDDIIPYPDIYSQLAKRIAADTEGKLRQALIEMGWTPPAEQNSEKSTASFCGIPIVRSLGVPEGKAVIFHNNDTTLET